MSGKVQGECRPEGVTTGAGVVLDQAVAGVALATDPGEDRPVWFRAVCLSERRAWAADQNRLHVADLPQESAAVDPPLWLHGLDLLAALSELPQWVPGRGRAVARIAEIGADKAIVALPAETAGPPGELRITVRRLTDDEGFLGFTGASQPLCQFGPNPDVAVVSIQAQYLRDALEAVAGNLGARDPVTLLLYKNPPGLVLVTEVGGRQRAAVVAPLAMPPACPWWWDEADECGEGRGDAVE